MSSDSGGNFAIGLILGVAIGIGIGFMYAPQPGAATRALLKEKAIELSDKAEELADKVKEGAAAARSNLESRLSPIAE
ncbi:YtxH domain-containing protein [Dehalogenimonas alkenigignens]|uniref:YtxH-like protein n=1 Tax=Dehalogenimonas alkenigignens TaxID=1217799 RepID=A0A0W0GJ34_9CHLR|nr:YtxH domain-containing protein [Dehalogenimonas alkenigignens]KTB48530.1 YtxH-like protein [Dehalogenimonas alkenigignens]